MLWLSVFVILLVIIIVADNIRVWLKLLSISEPIGMNDERDQVYCPIIPADAPPDARP